MKEDRFNMGSHPMRRLPDLLLVLAFCLSPLPASAQAPKGSSPNSPAAKPSTAAVPAAPERTTASFGDWVMRCESVTGILRRVCEVAHMVVVPGQTTPIAQVAIGRGAPNEDERLTIVVPPNITIGVTPQIVLAKASAAPIELTWQRCLPGACLASAVVSNAAVGDLSAQTEPGRIVFKNAANQDAAIPVSFRGLSQALAALAKEK
ncbi:MAG: invasion associated locus B family protein [Rhizobiales bacterium]|nr:invasion associated locus B family protein [Hyphomicrobiales bacterium]